MNLRENAHGIETMRKFPVMFLALRKEDRVYASEMVSGLHQVEPLLMTSVDDLWHALHADLPEAVVAIESAEASLSLFQIIRESFSAAECPELVLITHEPVSGRQEEYADAILPPVTLSLHHYLRAAHRRKRQRQSANEQAVALAEENQALRRHLQDQQRSVDELELLKSAIVRNVAHELGTPLLQVKAAVSMMAEDAGKSTLAQLATDATARLEAVVKNITQLAQSLDDMSMVPMIMREAVELAMRNLGRTWKHKDAVARVEIRLDDGLPLALGDRQGISSVIQLLIDNALKFSEDPVEVQVTSLGEKIHVVVSDRGIGIPTDKIENIFDPFFQIDSSSTRRYGGVGVGLAIVRLILERHGVHVLVHSEEGKGSTFSFSLPIADIHAG